MRWTSLALLLALAGCSRAVKSTPSGVGPGQACMVRPDCQPGLRCEMGTCEFPGPCSGVVDEDGRVQVLRYAYDDQGFMTAQDVYGAEREVKSRLRFAWSPEHRQMTLTHSVDGGVQVTQALSFDESMRLTHLKNDVSEERRDWAEAGGCLQPPIEYSEGGKTRRVEVSCDGRRPTAVKTADTGEIKMSYVWRDDRLVSQAVHMDEARRYETRYVRHADGWTVGRVSDWSSGEHVTRETYDMSCWSLEGGRWQGGPKRTEIVAETGFEAALAAKIAGRWRVVGERGVTLSFTAQGVEVASAGKAVERPAVVISDQGGEVRYEGDGAMLSLKRVDDGLLLFTLTEGGKSEQGLLVR